MHTYIVIGADRNTGEDVRREYTAPSAQDAENLANQDGIMVQHVEIAETVPPIPSLPSTPPPVSGTTDQRPTGLSKFHLPQKVRELIHDDEKINYASRPSKAALIVKMVVYGVGFGIVSLGILLPVALVIVYLSWKNTYYVITDGRTIVMEGIFNVATKIILNKNIQLISINSGMVDRRLKLNSIELATAAQGGGDAGILSFFPGMSKGCVTLRQVEITDVIKHYAQI